MYVFIFKKMCIYRYIYMHIYIGNEHKPTNKPRKTTLGSLVDHHVVVFCTVLQRCTMKILYMINDLVNWICTEYRWIKNDQNTINKYGRPICVIVIRNGYMSCFCFDNLKHILPHVYRSQVRMSQNSKPE